MIKERLKELDIKITELASYLSISRPTMYKFIEMYDEGSKNDLSKFICELFEYIETNELIDKKNVISYILSKVVKTEEVTSKQNSDLEQLSECRTDDNNLFKQKIAKYLNENNDLDELIAFVIECSLSSKKKKINKKDEARIQALKRIQGIYKKENK